MSQPDRQDLESFPFPERQMLIIRHGNTHLNSSDMIRGWADIPLDEEGRLDAKEMGNELKANPPDCLYTSDLSRATETAEIISGICGSPIKGTTEGLRPWNLGDLNGQLASLAHPYISDYAVNKPDEPIPGGESFNQFKNRFLDTITQINRDNPRGIVGIVTHHRGERMAEAWGGSGYSEKPYSINLASFLQRGIPPGTFRLQNFPSRGSYSDEN